MAITIGSNVAALQTQRNLAKQTGELAKSYQRLASGLRISRASDDAAGLAISQSLSSNSRLLSQSVRNANDGISMLSIAEGAMRELSSILTRINELAEQAANGTYSRQQRMPMDREAQQLRNEFNRILSTASFNDQKILNGSTGAVGLQVGIDGSEVSQLAVGSGYGYENVAGDGTYVAGALMPTSSIGGDQRIGDLNNDGNEDIVVGAGTGSGGVYIRLGNGNGTLKAASFLAVGSYSGVDIGDINGDGLIDIGATDNSGSVKIWLNSNTGAFTQKNLITDPNIGGVGFADLNGDGKDDVFTLDAPGVAGGVMRTFISLGDGTFSSARSYATAGLINQGWTADINEDGTLDLLVSSNGNILAYSGKGDGTFSPLYTVATGTLQWLYTGDVNGDGHVDFINCGIATGARTYLGNGNGTFRSGIVASSSVTFGATLADLNEDGFDDILASDGASSSLIGFGNADGTFGALQTVSTAAVAIRAGDMNNDGALDLVGQIGTANSQVILTANTKLVARLEEFSLMSPMEAKDTLTTIRGSLDSLSRTIGKVGAGQSRLTSVIQNNETARINYEDARSRIADIDVAEETANLVRLKISQNAATAVLGQAKTLPEIALALLGNVP